MSFQELHKREQNLLQKITDQEEKRKELEEEKKRVDQKAEEYNHLIGLLKEQQESRKDETDAAVNARHTAQLVRPPRTKIFSFRKYIQKILGSDSGSKTKMDSPLPNRLENVHVIRRVTSTPANTTEKKTSITSITSMGRHVSASQFSPSQRKERGHKRRSSDEIEYKGETIY